MVSYTQVGELTVHPYIRAMDCCQAIPHRENSGVLETMCVLINVRVGSVETLELYTPLRLAGVTEATASFAGSW